MSYSRVSIQEANQHLKQLHQKVFELENQVQMKEMHIEELQKTNLELQEKLHSSNQIESEKDLEISQLLHKLEESENLVQRLLDAAQERDEAVLRLEAKARLFYEVVEHRPVLARIVQVLDELSDSTTVSQDEDRGSTGDHENEGGRQSEGGEELQDNSGNKGESTGTDRDPVATGNELQDVQKQLHDTSNTGLSGDTSLSSCTEESEHSSTVDHT